MLAVLKRGAAEPKHLIGTALARVLFGVAGLNLYLSGFGSREFLWGPDGVSRHLNDVPGLAAWSVYNQVSSDSAFQLLFFVGVAVAFSLTILGGRLFAVLHLVFLLSLYARNNALLDGGDNLAAILVWLLPLMITDSRFSPLGARRRLKLACSGPSRTYLVHNVTVVVVIAQLAIIYAAASGWKLTSAAWRQGTAMYYVAHTEEFRFLSFTTLVDNPTGARLLSYLVIATQLAFVVSLLHRRTRPIGVIGVGAMHVGIAVTMGLVSFSLVMSAALSVVPTDDQYRSLRRRLIAVSKCLRRDTVQHAATEGHGAEPVDGLPTSQSS